MVRITEGTASLAVGEGPIFVLSFVLISVAMLAVFGTIPRMRNPEEEQSPARENKEVRFLSASRDASSTLVLCSAHPIQTSPVGKSS